MTPLRRRKLLARLEAPSGVTRSGTNRERSKEHLGAWATLVFIFIVLTICVSPNLFQRMPTAPVGSPWDHPDMVTPYRLVIPDEEGAERQKNRLQADHVKVFSFDTNLELATVAKTKALVATLAKTNQTSSPAQVSAAVRKATGFSFQPSTYQALVAQASAPRTSSDLTTIFHHLLEVRGVSADKSLLNSAIRSDRAFVRTTGDHKRVTSPSLRMVLGYPGEAFDYAENSYLATFQISPELKSAYADVVRQLLKPNISYDREQTEARLQLVMSGVNPKLVFEPGSVVARRGEAVTANTLQTLDLLGAHERKNDLLRTFGSAIVMMMAVAFTGLYARRFNRDLLFTSRSVLLVALPVVLAISLGRVTLNFGILGAFALPAGMVGILTVMLFDERFAIVLTTMTCVLFSVSTGLAFPHTIIGLAGGYTAIASLRNLQERREVLFTGFYIAGANCLIAVAIGLIINPAQPDFSKGLLESLANGLLCYVLAVGSLPIFEGIFQVTTDVRLLELTGANNKLLHLMEEKAPGSMHHSMNVATLAEAAAEAVGAHYLLVRAGAYFHDVGKTIKPTYFTENQSTPEQKQVHSKLSPAMSTLIIKNHVKEGVELARGYHLPEKVIDFIPEHHGTTLIKYFYVQALKKAESEGSDEVISEDEYRYPGPRPRSIETAILMLADSVEAIATSRFAGKSPDEIEIRRAVHEAVREKHEDRQLDNSPLTFRDLEIIKEAFVRVLQNRFHQRIKYPTMPGKNPVTGARNPTTTTTPKKGDDSAGVSATATPRPAEEVRQKTKKSDS